MLLPDFLRQSAERHPDKPAVIFPDTRLSYRELDLLSDRVAARLQRVGIGPGDRVGILWENAPAALAYFWGVLKSGAESVDVPSLAGTKTIAEILDEARPKALAVQPKHLAKLLQEQPDATLPGVLLSERTATPLARAVLTLEEIAADGAPFSAPPIDEHATALVVYTSGTTGRPKGVMLSHHNLASNLSAANALVGLDARQRILLVVPFYFIHGRMQLLMHALISGTVVVSAGFQFPQQVLGELVAHEVTAFSGVPYHFVSLVERSKLRTTALPHLEYVLITGGAMSLAQLDQLKEAVPHVGVHTAYGQTEASPRITWLGPQDMFGPKKGSAGIPLPGVKVEIVDERGEALPRGEVGEVVASGPNIMKGYVSGDERSSGRIDDRGRLRTGDLGRFDADGYLWLMGRSSDMIKSAGERIFPKEIEDVLNTHPAIAESAVIGVKDPLLGEKIVTLAVLRPGTTLALEDLRAHALQSLPFVRLPRALFVVPELPKTGSGKIDRGAVKKLVPEES
ncbi:MAG: acyl--CoA ligase [Deltaproteobacteria bacterium]|nr:acyl--CoA ligase [Deltaproteobacteria bacterium]